MNSSRSIKWQPRPFTNQRSGSDVIGANVNLEPVLSGGYTSSRLFRWYKYWFFNTALKNNENESLY